MKVLWVDDEADILSLARIALRFAPGVDLTTAESGAEALAILGAESFDALVIDAMMPAPDGPEVVRRLRSDAAFDRMVIVIASATTQGPDFDAFVATGADRVISKPFDLETLPAMLEGLIAARSRG